MPELRFDPLRREWVAYATERNDRTFLPTDFCPLCPSGPNGRSEEHLDSTGRCLHCEEIEREAAGPRSVFSDGGTVAFVPNAARWPYEVHVYPRRHVASIADLDAEGRADLADALLRIARAYDHHFSFSTPYVMAMHQAPSDGGAWPEAHLHVEFYPPHRRHDRLKYLAGVELGAGTFVNDTRPEDTAAHLREAVEAVVSNPLSSA